MDVRSLVTAAAQKYGVDPDLALSIGHAESGLRADIHDSPAGAIGPMQLMPGTAKDLGVDPRDPRQNVDGGVRYIAQLAKKYGGDHDLVAAAYNAGPGAVDHFGGVPPFAETQAYVHKVTGGAPTKPPPASTPELDAIFGVSRGSGAQAEPQAQKPSPSAPPSFSVEELDKAFGVDRKLAQPPQNQRPTGPTMAGVDRSSPGYKAAAAHEAALASGRYGDRAMYGNDATANLYHQGQQGESFGFSDELGGYAAMGRTWLEQHVLGYKEPYNPAEAYQAAVDRERGVLAEGQRKYPVSSTVAQVGGALAPSLLTMGGSAAATSGGALTRIAASSGVGALQGGVYGLGSGEGNVRQRAPSALGGAATGALAGGVLGGAIEAAPTVVKAGQKVARSVGEALKPAEGIKVLPEDTEAAAQAVSDILGKAGKHRDDLAATPEDSLHTTAEAIGPRGTKTAQKFASDLTPEAAEDFKTQIADRAEGAPDRLLAAVSEATGVKPETARGDFESWLETQQKPAVKAAYDKALDVKNPRPVMTPKIAAMLEDPDVASAYSSAKRLVADSGRPSEVEGPSINPSTGRAKVTAYNQSLEKAFYPTPETLDVTKKLLGQSVARDPFNRVITSGPEGVKNVFRQQASQRFTAALKEAVPGYADALEAAGDTLQARQAFENGRAAMANSVSDFDHAKMAAALKTPTERDAFRAGHVAALYDLHAQNRLTPQLFAKPLVRDKLTRAFQGQARPILAAADNEAGMLASGKSMTPRIKAPAEGHGVTSDLVEHAIGAYVTHGASVPLTALKYAPKAAKAAYGAAKGLTPGARAEVVRMLRQSPRDTARELQAFARQTGGKAKDAAKGRQTAHTVLRTGMAAARGALGSYLESRRQYG